MASVIGSKLPRFPENIVASIRNAATTSDEIHIKQKKIKGISNANAAIGGEQGIPIRLKEDKAHRSLSNIIAPAVSDGYIPKALPLAGPVSNQGEFATRVSALAEDISIASLAMLPIIQAQAEVIVDMGKFQQLLIRVLNTAGYEMMQVAEAHVKYLRKEHAKIQAEINAAEEHEGILGVIFGVLEMVVGIAISVGSDGAASMVGGLMIADGLAKTIAGATAIAKPSLVENNSALSGMLANGAFAVFGSHGQLAAEVFAIASMFLCSADSVISAAENLTQKLLTNSFVIANFATTCGGTVAELSGKGDKRQEQAASMGLAGLIIHEIIYNIKSNGTSLHDLMVSHLGDDWDMGIEMAISLVGSVGSTGYAIKTMKNFKAPDFLSNSKFGKLLEANSKHIMAAGAISQVYSSSLQAVNAMSEVQIRERQALLMEIQTYQRLLRAIINATEKSEEALISDIGQDISSLAKSEKGFVKGLHTIVEGDMQMVGKYAQLR